MADLNYNSILEDADALLIVPPFASYVMPSIGVHNLQSCAAHQNIKVQVLNLNMALSAEIGEECFSACCNDSVPWQLIFAKSAFDIEFSIKKFTAEILTNIDTIVTRRIGLTTSVDYQDVVLKIAAFYKKVDTWLEDVTKEILNYNYRVVGCSSTFGQTEASLALLKKIKEGSSEIITIIGGANCFGEMSEGILSLSNSVDYVFSGESEKVFVDFMLQVKNGCLPEHHVIKPIPQEDMDLIPLPVYDDYFNQLDFFFDSSSIIKISNQVKLPYETSRGCWWGEKKPCTFCGLNGETRKYREKSASKALEEISALFKKYPTRKISMVDNVMPQSYFHTFLPQLTKELPQLDICYEIRASVSLEDLRALARAGITQLQPGIESLSSSLLKRMDKGCLARHNIGFLRNTTALGLQTNWNILWGFPGDTEGEYIETLDRITVMNHLWPPNFMPMSIVRFSQYFNDPEKYGISELSPIIAGSIFLPQSAKVEKLASYFNGRFDSYSSGELAQKNSIIDAINEKILTWKKSWKDGKKPIVHLEEISNNKFCIVDTRKLEGKSKFHSLDRKTALEVLVSRPIDKDNRSTGIDWACTHKLGLIVDHWYVSLVTARVELLVHFN